MNDKIICKNVDTQSKRDAFIRYVSQCEDLDILLELLKSANEIIEEQNNDMEKMPQLAPQGF